jgi:broad specificity phosphatase PhoE
MSMPIDLVMVRHGQSEGNVATKAARQGDNSYLERDGFRQRHSSEWRLTELGIQQARQAGEWLKANMDPVFDRYYTSPYVRPMETAAHLDLPGAEWLVEPLLREREYGKEDLLSYEQHLQMQESARVKRENPLFWRPLNGESIADVIARWRWVLSTLHREMSGKRVIIVCHGELMETAMFHFFRWTPQQYADYRQSKDPVNRVHNGQIFTFSRRNPHTGDIGDSVDWFQSVCPTDLSLSDLAWQRIDRPTFSNDQLLELAHQTPRIISGV